MTKTVLLGDLVEEICRKKLICVFVMVGPEKLPGFKIFIQETDFLLRFMDNGDGNYFVAVLPWDGNNWSIVCMHESEMDNAAWIANNCGVWIEPASSGLSFVAGMNVGLPLTGSGVFLLNGDRVNPVVGSLSNEEQMIENVKQRLVAYV